MRALPLLLSLLLGALPSVQAYGKTMSAAHCRTHGHASTAAPDAPHDSHAQHHGPDAGSPSQHGAGAAAPAQGAHCECGCLCNVVCASGAALSASWTGPAAAPSREPWQTAADGRHPVLVHDSLLRPPQRS